MPDKPERMTVREFINLAREGRFDVLEFQRIFSRDAMWVRHLIDSLQRGIPINSVLMWAPDSGAAPSSGRYRKQSDAPWWIVDGQQRGAGILAAFSITPDWMPEDLWSACGGDRLEVTLTVNRQGRVVIAEGRHRGPRVSLAELLVASDDNALPTALAERGFPTTGSTLALEFDHFLEALLHAQLLLEWLPDDIDDPFLAFKRHNSRATQLSLKPEDGELSLLTRCFGPLQRDYVDPVVDEAVARHLGKTFTRKRINNALQLMLPADQRKLNAARADAETVGDAAERIRQVCPVVT
ncbi:GmrSD restriction endonuclease domain-containing protein [Saccharopolyspora sp. NPDC002578]